MVLADLHRSASEAGVDMLLEVRVFGGQVTEVWGPVLVPVPRMHRSIQSHGDHLVLQAQRGGHTNKRKVSKQDELNCFYRESTCRAAVGNSTSPSTPV